MCSIARVFFVSTNYVGGDPDGEFSPHGDGDEKIFSPPAFAGTGTGTFSPRGDGDEEAFPDGEFPVAIPMCGLVTLGV
jgi:hypothetical protein